MDKLKKYIPLTGRVLISFIFIMSGLSKIGNWEGTSKYMESVGMIAIPFFFFMAILIEVGGGISILIGFKARYGAIALIAFMIPTTLLFHAFWSIPADQVQMKTMQMIMFLKNISIIGALLYVLSFGAGPLSVDFKKENHE